MIERRGRKTKKKEGGKPRLTNACLGGLEGHVPVK